MKSWKLMVPVLSLVGAFASCATGQVNGLTTGSGGQGGSALTTSSTATATASSGGTGGMTGTGGAGTGGATSSTTSSSSSGSTTCGNGIKDGNEQCDGTDFGGATCQSLGFGSGQLMCNAFCFIVVSGCTPLPNCLDPMQSCADPNCVGKPGCVDSCMPPFSTTVPGFVDGDTTSRPSNHKASCSAMAGGSEEIFQVTAPTTGTMSLDLSSFGPNFSLSVRTACADDTSEIACTNKPNPMMFGDVTLGVPVTAGQTYFVVVQGMTPADAGMYSLNLDIPLPETACTDFIDDDMNGYTDCDDANCQMTSTDCVPGTKATGTACTANTDCTANHMDPVCLDAIDFQQFPNGYCSEFCNLALDDCSAGNICYAGLMISKDGVCLHKCTVDTDCRTADGYACVDKGLASKVCWLGPETICNDYVDNDFNNLTDCDDPNCQTLPACTPGSNAIGQPCTMHTDCSAAVGKNNPFCFDQANEGFPKGYCSHFCDPNKVGDCGAAGICVNNGPNGENVCMQTCTSNAQCRTADGYSCLNMGYPKMVCSF